MKFSIKITTVIFTNLPFLLKEGPPERMIAKESDERIFMTVDDKLHHRVVCDKRLRHAYSLQMPFVLMS